MNFQAVLGNIWKLIHTTKNTTQNVESIANIFAGMTIVGLKKTRQDKKSSNIRI